MTIDIERGSVDRPALSRCIAVAPEEFDREFWGTKPLLSRADTLPSAFSDLMTEAAVDELVSSRGLRTPFIRMAHEGSVLSPSSYTAPGGFGAEVGDQVSSEKVLQEFAGGATIVLQGLHRTWPPLIDFTRRLVDDLGHPIQVNAYITPASSRGFDPHYDVHDVFVLQIAGEKHWRIHTPVHVDPLRDQPWGDHRAAVAEAATHEPVIDAVFRPGDALYLPRGWIHSAEALGGTSVHLTIGVAAYTRADVVQALIGSLGDVAALRSSLPAGLDFSDPAALKSVVDDTLAAVQQAFADLAGHETDAVVTVSKSLTSRFASATRPEPVSPLATVDFISALSEASRVRWRGSLHAAVELSDDRESVRIRTSTKTVALPVEAEAAVRRLHEGGEVALGELPGLDAASAVVVVRRLLREGVLVPA
ncbi:cupin domain-containing protein [Herbiconiux sp. CPCC 205716]|uniref:Cupin domain-containing protein n=1 Tax=Herbiconiux gentiana TaxID=2970912 RepID=A0ABT2GES9_9MICO|nr:cupin domain-containing protein [Herbiconiux gentiana]MCS5714621.1 cupin domain-containing protein [Herbiconiux gentiana]